MADGDDDRDALSGSPPAGPLSSAFSPDSPTLHVDVLSSPLPFGRSPQPPSATPGTSQSLATSLQQGDLLDDGRYRITRFLGQGGMGAVYEAADLELGERVALKTLRPESAVPDALERFKREINVARRVTHPSVCRIYDLGRHRTADGTDLLFLTMQFLEGETLRERIKRLGPMSPAETLPLVRQMAAGLDAAHQAGVIHRDFKSGNVMMAPGEGGKAARAVITDFGLAREVHAPDQHESLTVTAGFIGTPAYASPEQIQGGEVGPASDIYALGIVVYECLTGRLPFDDAPTAWMAVVRRLHEPPTPPRRHVPGLDTRWEAAILRCLERRPADRFASGQEFLDALVAPLSVQLTVPVLPPPPSAISEATVPLPAQPVLGPSSPPTPPAPPGWPPGSWPPPGSGWVTPPSANPGDPPPASHPTATPPPGSWPPPPASGSAAWPPGTWPPGTWPGGAPVSGQWPTPPPGWVPEAPPASPRRWQKAAIALALLAVIVLGFWIGRSSRGPSPLPGGARRTVAVLGLANLSQEPRNAWLATALTEMLALEVAAGDNVRVIPSEQVTQMKASLKLPETSSYTGETLEKVRNLLGSDLVVVGNYLVSGETLLLKVQLQDAHTGQTVAQLSEKGQEDELIPLVEKLGGHLRRDLGMAELTDTELQRARRAFPEDARSARLYAEGLAYLHRHDLDKARQKLQEAVAASPESALPAASLAETLALIGNEDEARRWSAKAVELAKDLGRRDQLTIEARHLESSNDFPGAIAALKKLRELYPDDLEPGLALGRVQNRAGALDDSLATFAELRKLPSPFGDDPRIGVFEANDYLRKGDYDQALAVGETTAATARARGASVSEGSAYAYRGVAYELKGQNAQALEEMEKALVAFQTADYRVGVATTLATMAPIFSKLGDFDRAEARLNEAITMQEAMGAKAKRRQALTLRASLYLRRGNLAKARADTQLARQLGGSQVFLAELDQLGAQIDLRLGELPAAEKALAKAVAYAQSANHTRLLTSTLGARSELASLRGDFDAAQKDLDEVAVFNRQSGNQAAVASALARAAQIAADRGRPAEAQQLIDQALADHPGDKEDFSQLELSTAWLELVPRLQKPADLERGPQELRRILPLLESQRLDTLRLQALSAGIQIALLSEDTAAARELAIPAQTLLGSVETFRTRLRAEIALALVQARGAGRANWAGAIARLDDVRDHARRAQLNVVADEAARARAELEKTPVF